MRCQKLLVNWPFVTRHKVWKKTKHGHTAPRCIAEKETERAAQHGISIPNRKSGWPTQPHNLFFFFISFHHHHQEERKTFLLVRRLRDYWKPPPPAAFWCFQKEKKARALFNFFLKDNLYQFIRVDIFRYIQTRFLSIDVEFEKNGDIFRVIVSLACSTNPSEFLENQFPSRMSPEFRITSNRGKDKGDATILSVRLYYGYLDASLRQRISLPVWIRLTEDAKHFLPWPETYRASAVSHFISEINKNKTQTGFYYCQSR